MTLISCSSGWTCPCDMTSLMHHIIGASRLLVGMRDGASSSTDDDEGGDDSTSVPPPPPPGW
jgi:hypothetical protein